MPRRVPDAMSGAMREAPGGTISNHRTHFMDELCWQ